MVRLKADRNACRNPHSHLKLGLKSIEEYLASRMLVYPLRLLDFCPQSAGACVLILASEEKAKKITNKPVWVADIANIHQMGFRSGSAFASETGELSSQEVAASQIYKRNGITDPFKQIDVAEIYEPSTWEEMSMYEHYLWCEKNKGWELIEKGITELEGEFPVNPSGGIIATNAIGASPVVRIAEAALQVRGDAEQRVREKKGWLENERIRLLWFDIGGRMELRTWLEQEWGANIVMDMFGYHPYTPIDTSTEDSIFKGMAKRYLFDVPMIRQARGMADNFANDIRRIAKDYKIDCVIWPGHMGHKDSAASVGIMREMCRDIGVPFLNIGMDLFDPRYTTLEKIKEKMSQFFTTMGLG